jgi:hypothetical protein
MTELVEELAGPLRGETQGLFDSVNGLATESIHSAQDDNARKIDKKDQRQEYRDKIVRGPVLTTVRRPVHFRTVHSTPAQSRLDSALLDAALPC